MNKYLFSFVGLLALFSIISLPSATSANSGHETEEEHGMEHMEDRLEHKTMKLDNMMNRPMVMQNHVVINPNGEMKINGGKISEINGTNLEVSIWGLTFHVDASRTGVSGLAEGNQVSLMGTINQTNGVITATMIKGPNSQGGSITELQAKIQELMRRIEAMKASGVQH